MKYWPAVTRVADTYAFDSDAQGGPADTRTFHCLTSFGKYERIESKVILVFPIKLYMRMPAMLRRDKLP